MSETTPPVVPPCEEQVHCGCIALFRAERERTKRLEATLRAIVYLNGTKLIHREANAALKEVGL